MSFQSEVNELRMDKQLKLGSSQSLTKLGFKAPEGQKIAKVLAINADVTGATQSVLNGAVKADCALKAEAIVELETNEIIALEAVTNCQNVLELPSIKEEQNISAKHYIIDVQNKHSAEEEFEATIAVESVFEGIASEKINIVTTIGDVETEMETVCVTGARAFVSSKAHVEIDTNINAQEAKLLYLSADAVMFNAEAKGGYIDTKGKVYYSIIYEYKNGEDRLLKTIYGSQEFNHEIDSSNVNKNANCAIIINSTHIENKKTVPGDKNCGVEFEAVINMTAEVFDTTNVHVISDAYSLTHELLLTRETFESNYPAYIKNFYDNVSGSIMMSDNENRIHKILATGGSGVSLAKSYVEDDMLYLEGIINTTVVYLNEDEKLNGGLNAEVPFLTKLKVDIPENFSHVSVDASISDISAKAKKGKEIEIDANLSITATVYENMKTTFVTGAKLGEEIVRKQSAINILVVSYPTTLWALSKMYQLPKDKILQQNPEINDMSVIPAGTRIVIYNQK